MDKYNKLKNAYNLDISYEDVLNHERLTTLLKRTADACSCHISMFFLPLITTVCGLMGISVAKTHRENINFEEPNIIWSCVAAEPGNFLF